MFCKRCGKELAGGSKFCTSCGAAVDVFPPAGVPQPGQPKFAAPPTYQSAGPKKSVVPIIIGAVIGGSALIFLLIFLIAFPVYNTSRKNAQLRTCQANLRTIDGAINSYYAEFEKNPEDVETLVDAQFLKKTPTCPSGPLPYTLEPTPEGSPRAHCPNNPNHSY